MANSPDVLDQDPLFLIGKEIMMLIQKEKKREKKPLIRFRGR